MAFKMKGSPMQRNFGVGSGHTSALKQGVVSPMKHTKDQEHYHGPRYLPESYGGKDIRQEWKDLFAEGGKEYKRIKKKYPNDEEKFKTQVARRRNEWIDNWRHETNDPTMPSVEQAKKIVPEWSQYGEEHMGKNLNELWDITVPSSGSSHHGRIINANTGEGAAVPSWEHDKSDDRSEEDRVYDEAKYENIFSQNPQTLEEQGIIDPRKTREMERLKKEEEEDERLRLEHEERKKEPTISLEPIDPPSLTSETTLPELKPAVSKFAHIKEKRGYDPVSEPKKHKEFLVNKFGRKTGKKKFKRFEDKYL